MYNLTEKIIDWFCPPRHSFIYPTVLAPPFSPPRGLVWTVVPPHPYPEGLHGRGGEPSQAVPDLRAPSGTCLQLAPVSDADSEKGHRLQPSGRCLSLLRAQHCARLFNMTRGEDSSLSWAVLCLKGSFPYSFGTQFFLFIINMNQMLHKAGL